MYPDGLTGELHFQSVKGQKGFSEQGQQQGFEVHCASVRGLGVCDGGTSSGLFHVFAALHYCVTGSIKGVLHRMSMGVLYADRLMISAESMRR